MKRIVIFLVFITCAQIYAVSDEACDQVKFICNKSARFDAKNAHIFITSDYLYWKAYADGLAFALEDAGSNPNNFQDPPGNPNPQTYDFIGPLAKIDPNWDHGFRVGLGYNFSHDQIVAHLNWTSFRTNKTDQTTAISNTIWAHSHDFRDSNNSTLVNFAQAKWKCDLDVLNLDVGRYSYFGEFFSLHGYGGVEIAWIDQAFEIDYTYIANNNNTAQNVLSNTLAKSDFRGAGLSAGGDLRFKIFSDFSLISKAFASMLYGKFYTNYLESEAQIIFGDVKDSFKLSTSHLKLMLGLGFDRYFSNDSFHLALSLGFEENIFFSANQMNHFYYLLYEGYAYQEDGDLTFKGLIFNVRLDF